MHELPISTADILFNDVKYYMYAQQIMGAVLLSNAININVIFDFDLMIKAYSKTVMSKMPNYEQLWSKFA